MKVKDFMIEDVISTQPDTTLKDLLALLIQHRIGGVPVLSPEGKLAGIISDGDVIRYLAPRQEAVHDLFFTVYVEKGETQQEALDEKIHTTVGDIMKKKRIYTVHVDDDFDAAIRILSQHHFKKLPVVDDNHKVVGVISRGDIIHNLSKMIIAD